MASGEFWFVSFPAKNNATGEFEKLLDKTKQGDLAETTRLMIPELKVGTLDQLTALSDDLVRIDAAEEVVVQKICSNLRTLFNNDMDHVQGQLYVNQKSVTTYLKTFQWNTMKYRLDKSLREIVDTIHREVTQIDEQVKTKYTAYSQIKTTLASLDKKQNGNLLTRNLADIVKKEHFVLNSEYMTTLLVVVPRSQTKEWLDSYETLASMVVPRSSQKILEEDDYTLFNVTLFFKVVEDFKNAAREKRFIVREFKFDAQDIAKEKKDYADLVKNEKNESMLVLQLCKSSFSEVFSSWIHIKVIRIFIESVLVYGLPPNYVFACIKPGKNERKLREVLNQLYGSYGEKGGFDVELDERAKLVLGDKPYYPYVYFPVVFDPSR